MNHVEAISKYIETLKATPDLNVLVIEGPPGWGKTVTVTKALSKTKTKELILSSYSTPLNLYNFIAEHAHDVIVLDDCSGLFSDQNAMGILKAATWPTSGEKRKVSWGSTSGKAIVPEFEFFGKLIIICNSFPTTPDGEAVKSRGLSRRFDFSVIEAAELLLSAAKDKSWFPNTEMALSVAEFLVAHLNKSNVAKISYRTLKNGCRLAEGHPEIWKELLAPMLPIEKIDPDDLVQELATQDIRVKDQMRIFKEKTGLKERTFYLLRKENGLSRTA